jgi:hypothetical protein
MCSVPRRSSRSRCHPQSIYSSLPWPSEQARRQDPVQCPRATRCRPAVEHCVGQGVDQCVDRGLLRPRVLIMFAILVATAVFTGAQPTTIETADKAAQPLRPLAGSSAYASPRLRIGERAWPARCARPPAFASPSSSAWPWAPGSTWSESHPSRPSMPPRS